MAAIEVAYEGRMEMLRAIFGSGEEAAPPPEHLPVLTPALFDKMFAGKPKAKPKPKGKVKRV